MAATTNAWWAKVVPWAPSDYAPPPYTPTDPADINHTLFSAFRDNTFQKDGGDYRSGLAAGAGTFVGIAALLLFLLPIVYWVLSGAGGCRRTKAKEPGAGGARFLFWFAWLVVAVGTGFTAYGLFEFSKQVSAVGDDAGFLSDSLTKAQAAATGVSTTLTELQTTTATAIKAAATCTGAAVDLTDATNALNEAAAAAAAAASNADLQQGIDKTQEWSHNLTRTEASRIAAVSAFVALCAMFLLCFGVLVRRTVSYGKGAEPRAGCSKHFVRALAVTGVLVVLLGWVAAGAAALVAMVGGDFCQDPDANAKTLPPDNPFKDFYLTCTGTNVVTDSLQAAQQQLLTFAAEMATAFRAEAAAAPACAAAATRQLTAISTAAQNANAALVVALDATSCETVNSIYVDAVYESTCQDANRALAAMVLGSVLLFSGLVFLVLLWRIIDTQAHTAAAVLEAEGPRKRRSSLELPAPSPTTTAAPGTMVDVDLATPAPSSGTTTAAGKRFSLVDFDSNDVHGGGGRKGAPLGANV